jgi:hypothetical protein
MYFEPRILSGVYATEKAVVAVLFLFGQSGTLVSIIHASTVAFLRGWGGF